MNLFEILEEQIQSEVLYDKLSLAMYATDASLYQIVPNAIVMAENELDIVAVVNFSIQYGYKILVRGAGTSLAGQTVAKAIVIDCSKYMNKIISFNETDQLIVVQPGIVLGEMNEFLSNYGLQFPPDPATASRATIGGMIANNSSGTKSILYGKTSDYIISLKVLLSDGSIVNFEEENEDSYDVICQQKDREGRIYRTLRSIIFENREEIEMRFPKVMRRVSGYALDSFTQLNSWNLSKLVCGSEGTLGIILEAKLKLLELPKEKGICLVHYLDRFEAIKSVKDLVHFGPSAIEMLDYNVLEKSKKNVITIEQYESVVKANPKALLICEFYGVTKEELEEKIKKFLDHLNVQDTAYEYPVYYDQKHMNDVWMLRKKGLGLIMGTPDNKKPLAFIEDSSVPLAHLEGYIKDITTYCNQLGVDMVLYAHASVGVLHVRPFLDIRVQDGIDKMKQISYHVLDLVKKYGGSWSGEHGDGLVRSPHLPLFFGEKIMNCFRLLKNAFDPEIILNPNKKTDALPMEMNLRYGTNYRDESYDFVYQYKKDHSFESLVHLCSGIAACRSKSGGGMCPSYRATLDEKDSPRGRANALRMVMSGQVEQLDLVSDELMEVLELCLSCKACKSECPSNVDISKLKSEVLQLRNNVGKSTLLQKTVANSPLMSRYLSGFLAPWVNRIQQLDIVKRIIEKGIGIDRRRNLPLYNVNSFIHWYKKNKGEDVLGQRKVILFADTYINFHEVEIGIAAYNLLLDCGYNVEVIDVGCCQRPKISNGFLKEAKKKGLDTVMKLKPFLEKGYPILICEPGCSSALMDDLPDLIEDNRLTKLLKQQIHLIDEFLWTEMSTNNLKGQFVNDSENILIQTHCHQAAIHGIKATTNLCSNEGTKVFSENNGCCGMAGAFGYDRKHYELSNKIAGINLLPKINQMNGSEFQVIANGTSCRQQIEDTTERKAMHWVQTVHYVME